MTDLQIASVYLVWRNSDELLSRYQSGERSAVQSYLIKLLGTKQFEVFALPSLRFRLAPATEGLGDPPSARDLPKLVVPLRFSTIDARDALIRAAGTVPRGDVTAGIDLPAYPLDHWCPLSPSDSVFGNRAAARELIGAAGLPQPRHARRAAAAPVNVVVVDQGFAQNLVPAQSFGGGWEVDMSDYGLPLRLPGTSSEHGNMIVRSIHDLAPEARLFDLPIIPPRIDDPALFLHLAESAFQQLRRDIVWYQQFPRFNGPWLVVNAWGVLDRRWEAGLVNALRYSDNPNHPLNQAVVGMIDDRHDVVFAAGNCGQFCPSQRCGPGDTGPNNSIHGANGLARVVTAGAVRSDATWIGLSSQGPGVMAQMKPDICAPSHFAEDEDAGLLSTGTSAAAAMTVGVVAALRARWDSAQVPPDIMSQALRDNARPIIGNGFDPRYGHGVLDVAATVADLTRRF